MNNHAFKHICCNDNCFSHATACVDYLFLMKVIQFELITQWNLLNRQLCTKVTSCNHRL
ncbi:hypothetical protein HanPI659440_Chr07g0277991 [Helianthus annuus]|nr:hypothetical protein HanPI659440_Chr07g0277991 [Helianthus annuus]